MGLQSKMGQYKDWQSFKAEAVMLPGKQASFHFSYILSTFLPEIPWNFVLTHCPQSKSTEPTTSQRVTLLVAVPIVIYEAPNMPFLQQQKKNIPYVRDKIPYVRNKLSRTYAINYSVRTQKKYIFRSYVIIFPYVRSIFPYVRNILFRTYAIHYSVRTQYIIPYVRNILFRTYVINYSVRTQ